MLDISTTREGVKFLETLRKSRDWSQYKAANELGWSKQTYHYYEKSAKGIKMSELLKVQEVYGLSDQQLMNLIREEFGD